MDESRPEIRIGDQQRSIVDAHLRQALADGVLTLAEFDERTTQCWSARTRSELDLVTADLPEFRASPELDPVRRPNVGARIGTVAVAAAVIGAAGFVGVQMFASRDAISAFGSSTVTVAPGQDRVDVTMIFGSMKVVVPDGVRVTRSGTVLFGSVNCEMACASSGSGVTVDVKGAFGSVAIETATEHSSD